MELPQITLEQLQESGHRYRSDLVRIPVVGMAATTRFMTLRYGVRGKETVFSPEFNAELQHYAVAERQKTKGDFTPRTLETQFGACFFDFDPNAVIKSIFGHAASQAGEGAKNTLSAREVSASVLKGIGRTLNRNLFSAVCNPAGKTTADLFDGFDTITEKEIAAGNISEEKGNLIVLDEQITADNACELLKSVMFAASDELRDEDCLIYCSRSVADAYNENYLLTHTGINYNTEYNQPKLEGSDGRWVFAPCAGKKGSRYIHICPRSNMLVGVDQMSDADRVEFHKYEPKVVTGELYMFIGAQFESLAPERMIVVQLPDPEAGTHSEAETHSETGTH